MVYQTCAAESHANVVQLGAPDAVSALAAAKVVYVDRNQPTIQPV